MRMHIHARIHIYIHIYIYTHMYAGIYVDMRVLIIGICIITMQMSLCACLSLSLYIYLSICLFVCPSSHLSTSLCSDFPTYIYILAHMYIYTMTYPEGPDTSLLRNQSLHAMAMLDFVPNSLITRYLDTLVYAYGCFHKLGGPVLAALVLPALLFGL